MKLFYDLWYRFGTPPWVGEALGTGRAGRIR